MNTASESTANMAYAGVELKLGNLGVDLIAALLKSQGEIEGVSKDATNPHFGSKFADLTSVIDAVTPTLNKNGIVIVQLPSPVAEGYLGLSTILLHTSGQFIVGTAVVPLQKADPQGYASAMTYARRISLGALTNLKFLDDDAEAAVNHKAPARNVAPPQRIENKGKFPGKPEAATPPVRQKAGLFPTPKVGPRKSLDVKAGSDKPQEGGEEEGGEGNGDE